MSHNQPFRSEEDIRSKLVIEWLAGHGFNSSDFNVEYGFTIQLGRQIYRPRSDILVRALDGRNLLIIEVKSPDEIIDEKAKRQGISYARLLREGGIAPFVIVTNGTDTRIYDSITEEPIRGTSIPVSHPYVSNGYKVNVDDLALRRDALETLISLSPENLMEFCRAQVAYRMRLLKSEELFDGKKYVPQLYIERNLAKNALTDFLDTQRRSVVILEGPPQLGKTNFVCHTVEDFLANSRPCLFYPAIAMQHGLIGEICEDFQWLIGESSSAYQLVHSKINRILHTTGQRLVIFIDGWNEADLRIARALDRESDRLTIYDNIQIVISMTNVSANRLLLDDAGNPAKIAEAASINSASVPRIELSHEQIEPNWSVIPISRYSSLEIEEVYNKYSQSYSVHVPPTHQFTADPFLLRIAMEQFAQSTLPETLD